ncbi:hypothetical protein [Nocardia sp. NPDC046763]|uniref:hypothetical protein n=1 Tax=Nocardia sp. NPDC046763 TaxID=3155256 RepID=UPI0033CCDF2C
MHALIYSAAVTLEMPGGPWIQLLGPGFGESGFGYAMLTPDITAEQDQLLADAGWVLDLPGYGLPNRCRCFSADGGYFPSIAGRVVESLSEVLRVGSPAQLTVDSFTNTRDEPAPSVAALGLAATP